MFDSGQIFLNDDNRCELKRSIKSSLFSDAVQERYEASVQLLLRGKPKSTEKMMTATWHCM